MTGVDCLPVMIIENYPGPNEAGRGREGGDDVIVAGCARLRDRVRARLRAHQLDRALASGVPVELTPALALRARRLTALSDRRAKAVTFDACCVRPAKRCRPYVRMTRRERVAAAGSALSRLAEALAQPGPVAARGAAEASLLLTDGTGPLYNSANQASLERYALRALADLALA